MDTMAGALATSTTSCRPKYEPPLNMRGPCHGESAADAASMRASTASHAEPSSGSATAVAALALGAVALTCSGVGEHELTVEPAPPPHPTGPLALRVVAEQKADAKVVVLLGPLPWLVGVLRLD